MSGVRIDGRPAAATMMSACFVYSGRKFVPVWHTVTVAFAFGSLSESRFASGRPMVRPRPMMTTCWPSIGTLYITSSAWMPSGVHGRGASGTPMTSLPRFTGCKPSASLSGSIASSAASASRWSGSGTWRM